MICSDLRVGIFFSFIFLSLLFLKHDSPFLFQTLC